MAISSVASTREYGGYSYAVMLKDKSNIDASIYRYKVSFQLEEQDLYRFSKAFIGYVVNPRMTYILQE